MKFVKLHQDGKELLVNLSNVSEVYKTETDKSLLYFNSVIEDEQVSITVDESLDEIYEKVKGG